MQGLKFEFEFFSAFSACFAVKKPKKDPGEKFHRGLLRV
jgi:hypothetical protein